MFSRSVPKNQILSISSPLRFPQKLWKIANECQTGAVSWSPHGKSILLRYSLFKEEFMSTKSDFFKTDNISSFVRQLNLYGFRKVYDHTLKQAYKANSDLHEFSNTHFQRNRPDLLDKVTRKSGILKDKNDFIDNQTLSQEEADFFNDIKEDATASSNDENSLQMCLDENFESTSSIQVTEFTRLQVVLKIEEKEYILPDQEPPSTNQDVQPAEPVKKKRGRKPGSKLNKQKKYVSVPKSAKYFVPTLKHPEACSNLIYFDDEDDSVFLRNTSRDVILSSTLPFQETAEYLELKDTYRRLYQPRIRLRYSSLPVKIPYIDTAKNNRKLFNLRM